MKKSHTEKEPLIEEMNTDVNQKQTPDIHIRKGKKRVHKRDGCAGGGSGGGGNASLAGGAASGLAGGTTISFREDVAVSIKYIEKNEIISAQDVQRAKRKSPDDLKYSKVIGKRAARNIDPNNILKKGMVK